MGHRSQSRARLIFYIREIPNPGHPLPHTPLVRRCLVLAPGAEQSSTAAAASKSARMGHFHMPRSRPTLGPMSRSYVMP